MGIDRDKFDKIMADLSEMRAEKDFLTGRVQTLKDRVKSTERALSEHNMDIQNVIEDAELELGVQDEFTPWTSVLDYFVRELDMGDKWHPGAYEHNGKDIDLSSPEKLVEHMNFLIKERDGKDS